MIGETPVSLVANHELQVEAHETSKGVANDPYPGVVIGHWDRSGWTHPFADGFTTRWLSNDA